MHARSFTSILSLLVATSLFACTTNQTGSKPELEQRASAGDTDAQYRLGRKYANSAFPQDPEAIYWLCRAAKDGYVPAQLELALLYEEDAKAGIVTATESGRLSNRSSAYFWYTAAASQGSEQAFLSRQELAARMDEGEVQEVKRRATRWQQSVCVKP